MLAFARLRDGVSLQIASAEMSTIAQQLARQYPDADEGRGATVVPLTELIVGSLRPTLLLLLSGAALLLLIACVLFQTKPWDAGTLAAVAAVLAISAISASFIPARRAAAVEPTEALRAE